jgi:hypothetical protein
VPSPASPRENLEIEMSYERVADLEYRGRDNRDCVVKAIWDFLRQHDNLVRMENAVQLDRTPLEALSAQLIFEFGTNIDLPHVKQMIGRMVRQIIERLGYEIDRKSLRITRPCLFSSGATYRRKGQVRNRSVRNTPDRAWLEGKGDAFNRWVDAQVRGPDGKPDVDLMDALASRYGVEYPLRGMVTPGEMRLHVGILLRPVVPSSEYRPTIRIGGGRR